MARRSYGTGLNAYFAHTAFDLDIDAVRENRSRDYLELRLEQIDLWLRYLTYRVNCQQTVVGTLPERDQAGELMDIVYLQTVRRTIHETLKAL